MYSHNNQNHNYRIMTPSSANKSENYGELESSMSTSNLSEGVCNVLQKKVAQKQKMIALYQELLVEKKKQFDEKVQQKKQQQEKTLNQLKALIRVEEERNKNLEGQLQESQPVPLMYTEKPSIEVKEWSSRSISFALSGDGSQNDI